MNVNLSDALAAYRRAVGDPQAPGLEARDIPSRQDFAGALRDAVESAVETLETGESETLKAAAGKADINDVVVAMSEAEMTLQTVVAVRDRVIQAYQEILRMPI